VFGQRYNASATAQGGEFRVNTTTAGTQQDVQAAMDTSGNIIVTWTTSVPSPYQKDVYAQRYDASGVAQGAEFRVNTTSGVNKAEYGSTVAVDSSGNFTIAWTGWDGGIKAQQYNASGVAQGGEITVEVAGADAEYPRIAMTPSGSFVVTWYGQPLGGGDNDYGVFARQFDASGNPLGARLLVNTTIPCVQYQAGVAMDSSGNFTIVWQDECRGVYARRYNAAGVAQGGEFTVPVTTPYSEHDFAQPSVAASAAGDLWFTWTSWDQDDEDESGGVYARKYNAAGVAQTGDILINQTTALEQTNHAGERSNHTVVMDDSGYGIFVWLSAQLGTNDIFARVTNGQ
jgi:hypothetical protein